METQAKTKTEKDPTIGEFDVAVIGAGHAGIEAALASARLGAKTAVFTLSLDAIGNMPCNPAIGGTAKSHLVFEIDALGGEMGRAADATSLQSRVLNSAKGPAVRSLRVQSDRRAYHRYMKKALEKQENLWIIQDEVTKIDAENGEVCAVETALGGYYETKAAVVATGTYLGGKIFVGGAVKVCGPDGVAPALPLTESLRQLGIPIRRFKTGTPARVHRRSIDFSGLEEQRGDPDAGRFCFIDESEPPDIKDCYISYTNERTHEVIRRNLSRSPLYGGAIEGIGPRYCPSIEDKVVRFPEKKRHSFFIEPCGKDTDEMYLQGLSSSLPLDVQQELYRTIKGLEHVEIMRPAYAIEYDCCDPLSLTASLESKTVKGLFGAGQFCGTSGYEEAAAQGLIAGINAALKIKGKEPFTLTRDSSYIGTLIDDLVVKGVEDPYRMMTSRSEYRLLLREDNADRRLCEKGRAVGLLDDARWEKYLENKRLLERELAELKKTVIHPSTELNDLLKQRGMEPQKGTITLEALLRRPPIEAKDTIPFDPRPKRPPLFITEKAAVEIKYEGYIKRQLGIVAKQSRLEERAIPADIDYALVTGLSLEARDKLQKRRPASFGQALRISGVNPSDMSVLSVYLKKNRGENR